MIFLAVSQEDMMWAGPLLAVCFIILAVLIVIVIRKNQKEKNSEYMRAPLTGKEKGLLAVYLVLNISCTIIFMASLVGIAYGLTTGSKSNYVSKVCEYCMGNSITCPLCDGKGFIITQDNQGALFIIASVFGIVIAPVGYIFGILRTKAIHNNREYVLRNPAQTPSPAPAEQPQAVSAAPAQTASKNTEDLELYKELLDLGVITQKEFDAMDK